MPVEPPVKRAFVFIDGQNLFHHAKAAFGYQYPNFDPRKLAEHVCAARSWQVSEIHFYTGVPSVMDKPFWNHFWTAKMAVMGTRGIKTFSRQLRYRNQAIALPDGTSCVAAVGQEKGIDVRIALDVVRYALDNKYDVCLIFSQDQDLSEAVEDVKKISILHDRWIKLSCAFPVSPTVQKARGINGTDWIKIDRATYDACIDPIDYRLGEMKK
ncbi:MAG TPA: NYN domain-containing protein [Dissulfurispiraceae bacterium]|nr:NYN domain-containing protein [Dissulfurispiraceae bacterium]